MKLVWHHWLSFVELFVTRRTNPEGFSSAVDVFRQEAAGMGREELASSACGLRHPGSLNLPVLAQQDLAVGFTTFCPSVPSVPRGWIRIYLPGLQLQSSVGFLWSGRGPEELQAAKPSLGCVWMCLAVQVRELCCWGW